MTKPRRFPAITLPIFALLAFAVLIAATSVGAKGKPIILLSPEQGSKPKTVLQGTHGHFYDVQWKGWGEKRAVGHGRLQYSDEPLPDFNSAATITAMNLRNCGPWQVYTKWVAVVEPDTQGRTFPDQTLDLRGCPSLYCGETVAYYPDVEGGAGVEFWAVKMGCKEAGRVVRQCIKHDRVPGWGRAKNKNGEMILTRGGKKITMEGTAGGAPHCASG